VCVCDVKKKREFFLHLDRLLHYIPCVQRLIVRLFTDLQHSSKFSLIERETATRSSLRALTIITVNNIPFHHIENLSRHRFDRLETLTFLFKTDAASQSCLDYIDDQRWTNLLRTFVSLLEFRCSIELPVLVHVDANTFAENRFFRERNWKISVRTLTYSFNTMLHVHSEPYPKRRLDTM
jgi:hypothetical protein